MKNYLFVDVKDTYGVVLTMGGIYASVEFDKNITDIESFCNKGIDWKTLVISKNKKQIFVGGITSIYFPDGNMKIFAEHTKSDPNSITWNEISCQIDLSEEFIQEHKNDLNWYLLSSHYPMTEEFMERYHNKIAWPAICHYQKLSEEFVERHSGDVIWFALHKKQKFSDEFIERHRRKLETV